MYHNNGKTPLYVVKRKNEEWYHCGSYSSATPKLYMIGHAKSACKQLNKRLKQWSNIELDNLLTKEEYLDKFPRFRSVSVEEQDRFYRLYLENFNAGPWVVCELQLAASEIEL